MAVMKGAPLQASPEQNHDAHIVTHGTLLRNPAYKDNPSVQQLLMAHITEHLALKYQQEMMQMIPNPQVQQALMMSQQQGKPLPMEMQNQIALMAANASDKVLQLDEEKARIMAGDTDDNKAEQIELQKQDLALRAQSEMNRLKMHDDKMDLEEAKLMTTDENEDEDRKLRMKEAEMRFASNMAKDAAKTMDAAVKITKI
jgi:hypothetical protein